MSNSRISNSLKNISSGIIAQVFQMVLGFVSRTIFIKYLAIEYLGVSSLFANILTLLSVAELGITGAILFSLYKPLANNDEEGISKHIYFFKYVYVLIACFVSVIGLVLLPFLDALIDNPPDKIVKELPYIYLLFLANSVSSYLLAYKITLFHADQRSYVVTSKSVIISILQNLFQILSLVIFRNFFIFLSIQLVFQLVSNFYFSYLVNKHYPFLKKYASLKLPAEQKKKIYNDVKNTSITKIGGLVLSNSSNLVVSHFSGLLTLGLLSNYAMLLALASNFISQVFSGITGSIGNINAKETIEKKRDVFNLVSFLNFWLYGFGFVCFVLLANDFINIWLGQKFLLSLSIVVALGLSFFMVGMQNAIFSFKSTLGIFKQGRFIVLITSVINLVLSIYAAEQFGVFGVLMAIVVARLVTNTWYEPYILYKYGLFEKVGKFYLSYIKYVFILALNVFIVLLLNEFINLSGWILVVTKFLIIFFLFHLILFIFFRKKPEYKYLLDILNVLMLKKNKKS